MSLKKARENEQSHRKAQSNFMAMLAHEIKNPLSTLEASAYSLSLMVDSDAAGKRIRNHRMALDDISRIVDRLLELDAIENSKINVVNETFQMKQFLMDIVESASSPERIKMSCPIDRPIRTDPILTRRILMNLVDNALKYGEPTTPITLAAIPERRLGRRGMAIRCINAPGPSGLPDPAELFSKYYRAPTAKGVSGAGVGLWLCKQFVEAMSGVIQLDVRDHQISFYVWIPDLS
jgi:two-component system sensor histidine kinase KdpD